MVHQFQAYCKMFARDLLLFLDVKYYAHHNINTRVFLHKKPMHMAGLYSLIDLRINKFITGRANYEYLSTLIVSQINALNEIAHKTLTIPFVS